MDLHWITPTTSHPPLWCLLHVSLYRTANGGPLSSSFKIQTEVAVVFSSRRFRHHKVQEALPSSRSRCLPSRPRPPLRSASAQGVCLFPAHTLSRVAVTLVSGGKHMLCPLIPTLCQFTICCLAVPRCVKRSLTNSLQNTIWIGGAISELSAYSVVDNGCGF